ncbi:MAG: DUF421 domain-containing protein [Acidobacteria bacterium]|nr:DUF421 domain-containing protein [Acidobacteriota bacterium]
MHDFFEFLGQALQGQDAGQASVAQLAVRSLAIYVAGLVIIRASESRMLGRQTAFDVILAFLLGSMLSRSVNGSAPVTATIVSGALLIVLHRLLAAAAFRWHHVGVLLKGRERELVRDGRVRHDGLRRNHITELDLHEALRLNGNIDDSADVARAVLERNGSISVLAARREAKVLEVKVEPGVQTVRIEIA